MARVRNHWKQWAIFTTNTVQCICLLVFPFCPHNITKEEKRCEQLKKTNSKIIIKHTSLKLKFWSTINMKKVSTILSTILVCGSSGIFLDSLAKRSIFQQKQPICFWEEQIGKLANLRMRCTYLMPIWQQQKNGCNKTGEYCKPWDRVTVHAHLSFQNLKSKKKDEFDSLPVGMLVKIDQILTLQLGWCQHLMAL